MINENSLVNKREGEPLLNVDNLRVEIDQQHGKLIPVDGVSFQINAGEIVGVVGESGAVQRLDAYPHEFSGGMRQRKVCLRQRHWCQQESSRADGGPDTA